jgi:hypothetical protein
MAPSLQKMKYCAFEETGRSLAARIVSPHEFILEVTS